MISFAVVFNVFLCPGVFTVLGFGIPLARLPESAKPALAVVGVCETRPALELYDAARLAAARARVAALGKPAQLYPVRDSVVVGDPIVDWTIVANFKEIP